MTSQPPAIKVSGLRLSYGRKPALIDVGFTVPAGAICGLIGPNGAGKTSTLRIVATDLLPGTGRVELFGRDVFTDFHELRPRLGFMTETPDLFDDMKLVPFLEMFAALHGFSGSERCRAAEAAIELVDLQAFRKRRLRGLSRGEAQRVALARTLVHNPELLILDEPANGLDPRGRIELRELLLLLKERGRSILVSSHILSDLEIICDYLVLLDSGRVRFSGTREELRSEGFERERIEIQLAETGDGRLGQILAAEEGLVVVSEHPGGAEVELAGGADQAADLLARLVADGVRVSGFERSSVSLEELFMRLTDEDEPA